MSTTKVAAAIAAICLTHPAIAESRTEVLNKCREAAIDDKATREEYARQMRKCVSSAQNGQSKFAPVRPEPPTLSINAESGRTSPEAQLE